MRRMSKRLNQVGVGAALIAALIMGTAPRAVWGQDPPYRPSLQWHMAATTNVMPVAFTEDGAYLLAASADGYLAMVFRTQELLDPSTPKGHALVSYDYCPQAVSFFTDRDEANKEYVVASFGNRIRMWRWVRDPLAFRGGYLEAPKEWAISGWNSLFSVDIYSLSTVLVLRGDRGDRRYNRLVVSGDGLGNLRIVLLDYNATSLSPVVVSGAHGGAVTALAYDPATRRLITGGRDGLVRVWQVGLDGSGTPSLTALQAIPVGWDAVTGLAVATVGSSRYLVVVTAGGELSGWSWPNVSATPVWSRALETTGAYEAPTYPPVLFSSGYGDYEWVWVSWLRPDIVHFYISVNFVVDPASGASVYRYVGNVGSFGNLRWFGVVFSPPIGGNRYLAVPLHAFSNVSSWQLFSGLWRISWQRPQGVASGAYPVTALATLSSGGTRYLAAGYAKGEVRVYRNTGSGWTLWDSSTTLHPNKRVIGIRLLAQSGNIHTVSADVEGQLVIARHTGSVTPLATYSTGLSSAVGLDMGSDATSALVAVSGQQSGAPRVEVVRLTWSGSTPSFSGLAGFTVSGEGGTAVDVKFVQASGSADVVVATGTRCSRWNFSGSAYARALNYDDGSPSAVGVAGGRLWRVGGGVFTPLVEATADGANVWGAAGDFAAADLLSYPVLGLDGESAVWGLAYRNDSQDFGYFVARGRGLLGGASSSVAYNVMREGWQAALPDAPLALAQDPTTPDWFYVGCADGSIQQVWLPDFTPIALAGYAGLSGTLFEVVQNRIATFLTGYGAAFAWFGNTGVGIRHAAVVSLTSGTPLSMAMLCNADGSGCAPGDVGISALMRLTPSGNVLYGYEVANARLTGWSGTTMVSLFNTTSYPAHWWPIAVDDTRVALLRNEARGSYQIGTTTYYRYRPVIRIIKWTPSLVVEAERPLDENTEMGFIMTNPNLHLNFLQGMRWDMNASRRVAAVWGAHYYDPNTPSAYRRKVLLLYRPNAGNWGTWTVSDSLTEGVDFPSGVYPSLIQFHPAAPGVLYVGLSNGRLRIYQVNSVGQIVNRTNPTELAPTLGSLGAVSALDTADFVKNGLHYTAIVFGGPEGLSVWVGFVCQPGWINEVHFYKTDVAFFPSAGMGYIQVEQPDPSQPPYVVYSNGLVMSAGRLENLPELPCPEDVNRDGVVDDTDVLQVLFAFGGEGYTPADVNCDGLVDDSDLLQVLFAFGQQC